MSRTGVQVDGLKKVTKALKGIGPEATKEMRVALKSCGDFLVQKTKPQVPVLKGNAARSLKAKSVNNAVKVAAGGKNAPYYPWLDFGGKVGKHKSVERPFLKKGRYLYPTLEANQAQFKKILSQAVIDTARGAGLDVS